MSCSSAWRERQTLPVNIPGHAASAHRALCRQPPFPAVPPPPVLTGGRGAPLAPFPHALLHVTKSQTLLPDSPAKLRPLRIGQNPGLWSFILCVELAGPVYSGICSDITLDDSVKVVLFRSG